jgi:hypothetical protein
VSTGDRDTPLLTAGLIATGVVAVSFSGPIAASTLAPALAVAFWRNALGAAAGAPFTLLRRRTELRALVRDSAGCSRWRCSPAAFSPCTSACGSRACGSRR